MSGRGMAVVLIPDFSGESVEALARYIPVVCLQAFDPNDELMALPLRKRQNTFFQFSQAHLHSTMH